MDNQNNIFSNMMQSGATTDVQNNNVNSTVVQGNGFNNLIQPAAIPEVQNNSGVAQESSFGGIAQNNNLNQINDIGGFGIPQSSNVSVENTPNNNAVSMNSLFSNADQIQTNNVSNGLDMNNDLNNNVVQPNNSNTSLDFGFSMPGETTTNNTNVSNEFNLSSVVSPSVEQPQSIQTPSQPVNDTMGSDIGGVSSVNTVTNEVVNTGLSDNSLDIDTQTSEQVDTVSNTQSTVNNDNVGSNSGTDEVISVKKYLIHMILCCIPLVGIIILIMRALDKKDINIRNLARAQLILSAITVLISVILMFAMSSVIAEFILNM